MKDACNKSSQVLTLPNLVIKFSATPKSLKFVFFYKHSKRMHQLYETDMESLTLKRVKRKTSFITKYKLFLHSKCFAPFRIIAKATSDVPR